MYLKKKAGETLAMERGEDEEGGKDTSEGALLQWRNKVGGPAEESSEMGNKDSQDRNGGMDGLQGDLKGGRQAEIADQDRKGGKYLRTKGMGGQGTKPEGVAEILRTRATNKDGKEMRISPGKEKKR